MHTKTKKTGYDNGGKTDHDFTLDMSGKGLLKIYSNTKIAFSAVGQSGLLTRCQMCPFCRPKTSKRSAVENVQPYSIIIHEN